VRESAGGLGELQAALTSHSRDYEVRYLLAIPVRSSRKCRGRMHISWTNLWHCSGCAGDGQASRGFTPAHALGVVQIGSAWRTCQPAGSALHDGLLLAVSTGAPETKARAAMLARLAEGGA